MTIGRSRRVDEFMPADPEHFGVDVKVFIGTAGTGTSDSFDILVCSPSWMAEQVTAGDWLRLRRGAPRVISEAVAVGSGVWLMRRWDSTELKSALHALCAACSPGPDWGSVASRISRVAPWEFAYRYDEHVYRHYGSFFPPVR